MHQNCDITTLKAVITPNIVWMWKVYAANTKTNNNMFYILMFLLDVVKHLLDKVLQ